MHIIHGEKTLEAAEIAEFNSNKVNFVPAPEGFRNTDNWEERHVKPSASDNQTLSDPVLYLDEENQIVYFSHTVIQKPQSLIDAENRRSKNKFCRTVSIEVNKMVIPLLDGNRYLVEGDEHFLSMQYQADITQKAADIIKDIKDGIRPVPDSFEDIRAEFPTFPD